MATGRRVLSRGLSPAVGTRDRPDRRLEQSRMRIVLDMLNVARGGGLSVLGGLLDAWRHLAPDIEPVVLVARPEVRDVLVQRGFGEVLRFADARTAAARQWYRKVKLPSVLREVKPDVFMTNNGYSVRTDCPQLVHHQTLWTLFAKGLWPYLRRGPRRLFTTLAARRALAHADANVFISHYMRQCAERIRPDSRERNHVCYNGIDALYMAAARDPAVRSGRSTQISSVSFPTTHKDNETLLRSIVELRRMAPAERWHLRIIGWGDWEPVRRRAKDLGLETCVEFVGFLNSPQMIEVFRDSLCMVYPSYFEGFGLPVIEAMACGCPVVAVNATAIPEVAGSAAILVEPCSPVQVAEAVRTLFQDEAVRDERIRRGKVRALDFPWEKAAGKFVELFRSLAG